MTTTNQEEVLAFLNRLKPLDGWSIQKSDNNLVKLYRRNVPVSDISYLDIVQHENQVVGLLSHNTGHVLVDSSGTLTTKRSIVTVPNYGNKKTQATTASRTPTRTVTQQQNTTTTTTTLDDPQTQTLLLYGGCAVAVAIALRIVLNAFFGLFIVTLPLLYLYLVYSCPPASSFDGKQQLKRVLRGEDLPETHPDKPKNWMEQAVARVAATVTTELATLPGYEIEQVNIGNALILSVVTIPSVDRQYYWIGASHKWWFLFARRTPPASASSS